jgi:hypothetical protein
MDKHNPDSYFTYLKHQVGLARQSTDNDLTVDYCLLGKGVRLRFTSSDLYTAMTPALAHRQVDILDAPDLVVDIWDSYSSGLDFEKPDVILNPRYDIPDLNTETYFTLFNQRERSITMFNRLEGHAVWAIEDFRLLDTHVIYTEPLLPLFQVWGTDQETTIVHAASVGYDNQAVLLVGQSGAGKSTTAILCLRDGLQFLGEDYCIVHPYANPPYVESLYNTCKLAGWSTDHLPEMHKYIRFAADEIMDKTIFSVYPGFREQIVESLPISAIVVPQVTGQETTTWHTVSPAIAMRALAPSTIFQMIDSASKKQFHSMAQLVKTVPTYSIQLGTDIDNISSVVRDILADSKDSI